MNPGLIPIFKPITERSLLDFTKGFIFFDHGGSEYDTLKIKSILT